MIWIRTKCPWCGTVQVPPGQVTVRVCSADLSAAHVFSCPLCRRGVARPLAPIMSGPLLQAGSGFEVWHPPAELGEHGGGGQPLTEADLAELLDLLDSEDWLEQLGAPPGPAGPATPPAAPRPPGPWPSPRRPGW